MIDRTVRETLKDEESKVIVKAGTVITAKNFARISRLPKTRVKVVPYVSDEVNYFSADREDIYTIAQANAKLDERSQFVGNTVEARLAENYVSSSRKKRTDEVTPKQIVSVATALIPILVHDDATARLWAQMQRQAVPWYEPNRRWWLPVGKRRRPSTADNCSLPRTPLS